MSVIKTTEEFVKAHAAMFGGFRTNSAQPPPIFDREIVSSCSFDLVLIMRNASMIALIDETDKSDAEAELIGV